MEIIRVVSPDEITVYWDGQCPFCSAMKERLAAFDTRRTLLFVDLNDPEIAATAAARFTRSELVDEMRVRMPDGTWRTGYFAWAAALRALPALAWFGTLMQLWVFADIGPKVYRWVANHRYLISQALRLPSPCNPNDACRIA